MKRLTVLAVHGPVPLYDVNSGDPGSQFVASHGGTNNVCTSKSFSASPGAKQVSGVFVGFERPHNSLNPQTALSRIQARRIPRGLCCSV